MAGCGACDCVWRSEGERSEERRRSDSGGSRTPSIPPGDLESAFRRLFGFATVTVKLLTSQQLYCFKKHRNLNWGHSPGRRFMRGPICTADSQRGAIADTAARPTMVRPDRSICRAMVAATYWSVSGERLDLSSRKQANLYRLVMGSRHDHSAQARTSLAPRPGPALDVGLYLRGRGWHPVGRHSVRWHTSGSPAAASANPRGPANPPAPSPPSECGCPAADARRARWMRARCWRRSSPGTWRGTCRRCSGWPMPMAGTGPRAPPGMRSRPATSRSSCARPGIRRCGRPSRSKRTAGAARRWSPSTSWPTPAGERRAHRGGGRAPGLRAGGPGHQ